MQMKRLRGPWRRLLLATGSVAILCTAGGASAADLHVLASTALKPLFEKLGPEFEAVSGDHLVFAWGASYGDGADTLPGRLRNGERADVVVMIREALDQQVENGHVRSESVQNLATSRIGLAVQAGAPRPDIAKVEGLRRTLLGARSVAFSSGVSGVYLSTYLFPKMGIANQLRPKSIVIEAPHLVGQALLEGKAEVGLQQMSELLAVPGVEIIGPLPDEVQRVNIIAAAVTSNALQFMGAEALIRFMLGPEATQELEEFGFGPMGSL
ncbi:substrate-binding domain-containing protein [Pseudomonas cichorii]|nr:substrate-binding domain-containing protein [Pseudomonas cichorii]MBX8474170.1 substrate-binding domain-containing protein [Pseudomonas cichorii]GFM48944.1 molybdenum ABC transporter substrate-binding protein [Pseudomonas cichorii]